MAHSTRAPGKAGGWIIEKGNSILRFDNSQFSAKGVSRIETALNNNQTLKTLSLANCRLTDGCINGICDFLENNAVLQELWLGGSPFEDEGFKHILNGLSKNQSLVYFSMPGCVWTDMVSGDIENFLLWNSTLRVLDLSNGAFSTERGKVFFQRLMENKSLMALDLHESHLTDGMAEALSHLFTNNPTLSVLNVHESHLTDGMAEALRHFATNNSTLSIFKLENSPFSDAGMKTILEGLAANNSLQSLSSGCKLTDTSAGEIANFATTNSTLRVLELDCEDGEMKIVLEGLAANNTLQELRLPRIWIPDTTAVTIEKFLVNNSRLVVLNMDDKQNKLNYTDKERLQQALGRFQKELSWDLLYEKDNVLGMFRGLVVNDSLKEFSVTDYRYIYQKMRKDSSTRTEEENNHLLTRMISELQEGDVDLAEGDDRFTELGVAELKLDDREEGDIKEHQAADLFFEAGGVLQLPMSDVILKVPAQAVPAGKAFVVHGTVHTDLKKYNRCLSEDERIVGPVVEYEVETGETTFKQPVQITIPHCLPANRIKDIRVLFGEKDDYREVQENDPNVHYTVKKDCVVIHTTHFTTFIITTRGREEEITDALLTVAASKKETPAKTVTCLRLMLHSGCTALNDFSHVREQYYDPDMTEISRTKVTLPENEDAIASPTIFIELMVDEECEAIIYKAETSKMKRIKVQGKNVLRLTKDGQNRSEKLANFSLDDKSHKQLQCSIEADFQYGGDIENVVEEIRVVYPEANDMTAVQGRDQPKITCVGDLTYERMKECITSNLPEIYQRLEPNLMLLAHLVAVDVIGLSEKDEMNAVGMTRLKKNDVIIKSILEKGVKAFLDFCLVLDTDDISQTHIVVDTMGLVMDYIRAQRGLLKATHPQSSMPPQEQQAVMVPSSAPEDVSLTAEVEELTTSTPAEIPEQQETMTVDEPVPSAHEDIHVSVPEEQETALSTPLLQQETLEVVEGPATGSSQSKHCCQCIIN